MARRRKSWLEPTRQIRLLAVLICVCCVSLSLFHSLTLSKSNNHEENCWYGIPGRTTITDTVQSLRHAVNHPPETVRYATPPLSSSVVPNASFAKAFEQSYGLMDDIAEASWDILRERAHSARSFLPPPASEDPAAALARIDNPVLSYLSDLKPDFVCPHPARFGVKPVGGGHGAIVPPVWTCNVHRLTEQPACLIYSFGGTNEYKWHDGLLAELNSSSSCEIHVFDEGVNGNKTHAGVGDLQVNNIHYHSNWSLKSSYHAHFNAERTPRTRSGLRIARKQAVPLTFQETRRILGHENRTIDVLLVDCHVSVCEW